MNRHCKYVPLLFGALFATACGEALEEGPLLETPRYVSGGLTLCSADSECGSDEACTQGGHCVNVTGERDATEALQADLDALPPAVGLGVPYRLPDNAVLQINDLNNDGTGLRIEQRLLFDGRGALLKVQNGIIGIRVGQGADWASLRNFRIDPQTASAEHSGIGIDVRGHGVRLDNIYFWRMGTGVRAYTYVGDEFANINSQQWARLTFRNQYEYAIDIRGGDANAGLMSGIEVIGGAGIYERSFLGNTYIAPTMEGTHTRSLEAGSNAGRNLILGAYIEEGDPIPTSQSMHDLHVGGNAVSRVTGPGDRIGNHASRLRFTHPDSGMEVRIPGSDHAAMAWRHHQEGEWWFLRYWTHPTLLRWGISYRNQGTAPFYWTGAEHPQGPAKLQFGEVLD
jgi:hypothetical protein